MAKYLVLNQVTLCADGSIGIQWMKQIAVDGELVLSEPHRSVIDFDGDIDDALDNVFSHVESMGYSVSPAERVSHRARVAAIDAVGRADPAIEAVRQAKILAKG